MAAYRDRIEDWPVGDDELSLGQPEDENAEYYVGECIHLLPCCTRERERERAREGEGTKEAHHLISLLPASSDWVEDAIYQDGSAGKRWVSFHMSFLRKSAHFSGRKS